MERGVWTDLGLSGLGAGIVMTSLVSIWPSIYAGRGVTEALNPGLPICRDFRSFERSLFPPAKGPGKGWPNQRENLLAKPALLYPKAKRKKKNMRDREPVRESTRTGQPEKVFQAKMVVNIPNLAKKKKSP